MLVRALTVALSAVGPEAKYFFVRFVQCFGVTDPVRFGVKDLANRFGLSDRQVSKSLAELVDGKVLELSLEPAGAEGRQKRTYRIQEAIVESLNATIDRGHVKSFHPPPHTELHGQVIGRLVEHGNAKASGHSAKPETLEGGDSPSARMRAKRLPGRLSVVNRLLLGVLLCYADRFGVVRDVGHSALRRATGLSQERLRHRIGLLIVRGVIRAHVPGATSSVLFKKTAGVYFLNLHHPDLAIGADVTSVMVYTTSVLTDVNDRQDFQRIMEDVSYCRAQPSSAARELPQLAQIVGFFEQQRSNVLQHLQIRLERYACYLLSTHWTELASRQLTNDPDLRQLISKDFSPPKRLAGTFPSKAQHDLLLEELYARAWELAIRICLLFNRVLGTAFELMDFAIIPQTGDVGYRRIVLLALPRGPDDLRYCFVVSEGGTEQFSKQAFEREADIPAKDQYRYGLRCSP